MTPPGPVEATWNVVATLSEDTFRDAVRLLGRWGKVKRTHFYNVLAMRVEDPAGFLRDFTAAVAESPGLLNTVSHVMPGQRMFDFATREEFEQKAREIVLVWVPDLRGASFYVRLHRRGYKGVLSSQPEERLLDEALLQALAEAGTPGRINFEDADKMIQIETIDGRAAVSLWTREDRQRCPFLGID
jgi:tRNA(Ser,Leu) C12 N-acetylase TAN1